MAPAQQRHAAPTGVDRATLDSCTALMSFTSACRGEDESTVECSICLEAFEEGDTLRLLPCLHRYHARCADEWFRRSPACPICKHGINVLD